MNHRLASLFAIAAIFFSLPVSAQAEKSPSYKVTVFNAKGGFPSNIINVIDTDDLGRVWLGTDNGLVCNANYAVSTYRSTESDINFLKNNNVLDIAIEKDTIWMVTSYGLEYFNIKTRSAAQVNDHRINYKGLHKICVKDDSQLVLGGNGLLLIVNRKTKRITNIPALSDGGKIPDIKDILTDHNGGVWITTLDNRLLHIGRGSARLDVYPEERIQDGIPDLMFSKTESLTVASTCGNDILIIYNSSSPSSITRLSLKNKYGAINCCETDDEGNIWLATENGVIMMSASGQIWNVLDSTTLDSDWKRGRYLSVKHIEEGTVCLSCVGKGTLFLKRMRQEVKTYSPVSSGAANSTSNAIIEDWNGLLWIATEGKPVSFFDKTSERFVNKPFIANEQPGLSSANDLCAIKDEKRMFIAARQSGVWEYQEGKAVRHYALPGIGAVNCLNADKHRNIWVGTDRGISIIIKNNDNYKILDPVAFNKEIRFPKVRDFAFDGTSTVWVATNDQGIYRAKYDGGIFTDIRHYCIENNNLTCNNVNCIHLNDDGMIFIGTHDSGLQTYDAGNDHFVSVGENNMVRESISSIVEDSYGILWISTINGFLSYSPKAQGSKLKRYSSDYFDKNYSFIPNSAWSDGQTIAFGGYGGISLFRISDIREKHILPRPMIVGIAINNVYMANIPEKRFSKITDKFPPFTDRMLLRHNENKLRFNFANIYYDMTQNPKYSYMLSGVDNDWQYTDAKNGSVSYANLPPGKYTFSVRVQEPDNRWSESCTVDFTIVKPWWRRTWAIILYLVVISSILTLMIRNFNYTRHVKTLNERVDELVSDKNRIVKFFSSQDTSKSDMDKQMIDKIVTIIQTNLSNPDFDVEMLQDLTSMSASTLYRKVKALTGMSPSKFILNIRLKQACSLLLSKVVNVSEVAYKVGFSDPKYFSSSFKKEFGMTPSEYRSRPSGENGQAV